MSSGRARSPLIPAIHVEGMFDEGHVQITHLLDQVDTIWPVWWSHGARDWCVEVRLPSPAAGCTIRGKRSCSCRFIAFWRREVTIDGYCKPKIAGYVQTCWTQKLVHGCVWKTVAGEQRHRGLYQISGGRDTHLPRKSHKSACEAGSWDEKLVWWFKGGAEVLIEDPAGIGTILQDSSLESALSLDGTELEEVAVRGTGVPSGPGIVMFVSS